jgi:hypothetical protein
MGNAPIQIPVGAATSTGANAGAASLGTRDLSQGPGSTNALHETASAANEANSAVGRLLATMNGQDVTSALSKFQEVHGALLNIAQAKFPNEPLKAADDALQQGIGFLGAWAQALQAIRGQTDGLAAAQQKITSIVGGPLAANLNSQLDHMNTIAQANTRITDLTARRTQLEKDHSAVLKSRQAEDTGEQRAQQEAQFAQAAADRQRAAQRRAQQEDLQDRQKAENDSYTQLSRNFEDRQRSLTHDQELAARNLQHALENAQESARQNDASATARQDLLQANYSAATTPASKTQAAEASAIEADFNQRRQDAAATAIDDIQRQIEAQKEASSDALYDLDTERIAAQRAHEDRLAALDAESTAMQRAFSDQDEAIAAQQAAQQEADFEHRNAIEDQRAAQDNLYQTATDSIDAEIKQYQDLAQNEQQALTALQQAFNLMAQGGQQLSSILGGAVATAQQAQSLLNAQALSNFPNTGAIRNLGGKAAGGLLPLGSTAIVGDAPGGVVTPFTERVTVTDKGAVVTPLTNRPAASGLTINLGGLTVSGSDRRSIISETLARVEAMLNDALDAAERGDSAHSDAHGGARVTI